jgi:hypothetical protein
MNSKIRYALAAVTVVAVMCLIFVSRPAAQSQSAGKDQVTHSSNTPDRTLDKNPSAAPTPRMSDGHPSLTGFWPGGAEGTDDPLPGNRAAGAAGAAAPAAANPNERLHETTRTADGSIFFSYAGANGTNAPQRNAVIRPPYKPEYRAQVQKIVDAQYGIINIYDPNLDCKPNGVPRAGFGGFVVSSPQATAILYETAPGPYYRIVYTDGRPHPTDIDTSYMGHSIGHWEGDTLVVDTVALDDTTWLGDPGSSLQRDKEHVVEKWTSKGNHVTVDVTVEDPVMFTKPWVLPTKQVVLMTGDPSTYGNYILPAMCNTNDKAHLRVFANTGDPKDKYFCNWCNPESVYGGDPNVTTQGKPIEKKP